MTLAVDGFNALPHESAADVMRSCCGSSRWVDGMVTRRPFGSLDDVLLAADEVWASTDANDWHEAFAHHPRIGEKQAVAVQSSLASEWSAGEQSAMSTASPGIEGELARINREYEHRFGHIYLVCATDRSGDDLLAIATERLRNDPDSELRIAAGEQRKIMRLRLRKLFGDRT